MPDRTSRVGPRSYAAALAAVLWLWPQTSVPAQGQNEAPATSRGENFSAGKPPAALFASDCTGAGCHKGPQGLAKRLFSGGLASFLREHYTNSRESAAALANYLSKLPAAPEPKEKETRTSRPAKPPAGAAGWFEGAAPSSGEPGVLSRPEQKESRTPRQPTTRTSRAPADEGPEKPATPAARGQPAPVEPGEKPAPTARAQARQPAAASATAPEVAAAPSSGPDTTAAPAASTASPPPAPKQFDIFD